VQQQTDEGRDAALRAAEHAQSAAASAGLAAGAAAEALSAAAGVAAVRAGDAAEAFTVAAGNAAVVAAERGREVASVVRQNVRQRAAELPTPEVLEGVLEEAFDRGAEAWDALRGRHRPVRRWPWATGSALAGAALAVGVAVVVRRLTTQDPPGAQDPEQVQAVVDLAPAVPTDVPVVPTDVPVVPTDVPVVPADVPVVPATAPGPVDEDGEAVEPVDRP
jgi:hypothetical protein